MNDLMLDEMIEFVEHMKQDSSSSGDGRVHFRSNYFEKIFMNIAATLLIGKRFNYNDQRLLKLLHYEHEFIKNGVLGAGLLLAFPFLQYICPKALGYNDQSIGIQGFHAIARVIFFLFKKCNKFVLIIISLGNSERKKTNKKQSASRMLVRRNDNENRRRCWKV